MSNGVGSRFEAVSNEGTKPNQNSKHDTCQTRDIILKITQHNKGTEKWVVLNMKITGVWSVCLESSTVATKHSEQGWDPLKTRAAFNRRNAINEIATKHFKATLRNISLKKHQKIKLISDVFRVKRFAFQRFLSRLWFMCFNKVLEGKNVT